ncbi:MAG: putative signal transducing protein [Archangium sp.]
MPAAEAEVARSVLESAGLDAAVVEQARSSLLSELPPTDFQLELWAEETHVEQARELLSFETPVVTEPEERRPSHHGVAGRRPRRNASRAGTGRAGCVRCGSTRTKTETRNVPMRSA